MAFRIVLFLHLLPNKSWTMNNLQESIKHKELSYIITQLKGIYDGSPWYGKSIKNIISGIPARLAIKKPQGHPHSIFQILYHMAAWREFMLKKLVGEQSFDIKLDSKQDWPLSKGTPKTWRLVVQKLDDTQEALERVYPVWMTPSLTKMSLDAIMISDSLLVVCCSMTLITWVR